MKGKMLRTHELLCVHAPGDTYSSFYDGTDAYTMRQKNDNYISNGCPTSTTPENACPTKKGKQEVCELIGGSILAVWTVCRTVNTHPITCLG